MIIFDLDGTLYRTHETSLPALRAVCRKYGVMTDGESERFYMITSPRAFLSRAAPQMDSRARERFCAELYSLELEQIRRHGRLFDGVRPLLRELSARGEKLAVCSMSGREYIETVLERCKIAHFFSHISHSTDDNTKSRALAALLRDAGARAEDCVMIGDSAVDMAAARESHVPFVGVTYGYGGGDIAQAGVLVNSVHELRGVLYR